MIIPPWHINTWIFPSVLKLCQTYYSLSKSNFLTSLTGSIPILIACFPTHFLESTIPSRTLFRSFSCPAHTYLRLACAAWFSAGLLILAVCAIVLAARISLACSKIWVEGREKSQLLNSSNRADNISFKKIRNPKGAGKGIFLRNLRTENLNNETNFLQNRRYKTWN